MSTIEDICRQNSSRVSADAKNFPTGCSTFFGPSDEGKCHGTISHKPEGKWNNTAKVMMKECAESGHPVFFGAQAHYPDVLFKAKVVERTPSSRTSVEDNYCRSLARYLRSTGQMVQQSRSSGDTSVSGGEQEPRCTTIAHTTHHEAPNCRIRGIQHEAIRCGRAMKDSRIFWKRTSWLESAKMQDSR